MNPVKLFKLARGYEKFQSISKENTSMNSKIVQISALVATLVGTLGVPEIATKWVQGHVVAYGVVVGLAAVLHAVFPSIFSGAPSQKDQEQAGK